MKKKNEKNMFTNLRLKKSTLLNIMKRFCQPASRVFVGVMIGALWLVASCECPLVKRTTMTPP